MDWIKLYEEDKEGMERGKKIEDEGRKKREEFLKRYPIEDIPNLTIEQYVIGNNNSFCHWLRYGLCDVASMGNVYPKAFGVYTTADTGAQKLLSPSFQEFGSDYNGAFNFLKLDINNGFLMCPNHDKLFDKGYITMDDDGKIMISVELTENDRMFLNINSRMHIELTDGNKKYLKFHRENIFKA